MLKLFKNFNKKEWLLIALVVVLVAFQVWLELEMPDYMSEITMLIQTDGSTMGSVLAAGGKMLLCALGSLVSAVLVAVMSAKIASSFAATLRSKIFRKVMSFSMEEIGGFSTDSLLTRSTNDVNQVLMLIVLGLQVLIKAPLTAGIAIGKITGKSWQWTTATGAAVVVLMVIVLACIIIAMPRFKRMQIRTDNLNRVARENLNGLNVVRAYNAENYQEAKFEKANGELTSDMLFTQRTMASLMPCIQLIMNGLSLSIYWIGAYIIDAAGMMEKITLFSDMVVFSQYAMQIVMSFMILVMIFIMLPRALVSAKRICEILDTRQVIGDGSRTEGKEGVSGEVTFRNVSFKYPGSQDYVLKNISFSAQKGQTVALIGATGCGKSSVVNMVPRFYDATEGQVLVDGVDVKDYTQKALRNKIGYVSQKATMFSGTVLSNLNFGDNGKVILDDDVVNAVYTAQSSDFVDKLEGGYEAHIAQGGTNLSGGQKQRLSIARAIARQPEILIFDDSFSALDYKTDKALRKALERDCRNTTKLIVAQRIGTIRDADQIIVLEDGEIAGIGTHHQLMESCEVYRQIAYSQLSKEELA